MPDYEAQHGVDLKFGKLFIEFTRMHKIMGIHSELMGNLNKKALTLIKRRQVREQNSMKKKLIFKKGLQDLQKKFDIPKAVEKIIQ
mmetsp:Transcript_22329/g.34571  ORF Transcript_22329/g.34571 Transcript_22329/m.34571 type:complete len:86 (-) Transcript_22329:888-1145(-)